MEIVAKPRHVRDWVNIIISQSNSSQQKIEVEKSYGQLKRKRKYSLNALLEYHGLL